MVVPNLTPERPGSSCSSVSSACPPCPGRRLSLFKGSGCRAGSCSGPRPGLAAEAALTYCPERCRSFITWSRGTYTSLGGRTAANDFVSRRSLCGSAGSPPWEEKVKGK